jgi:choline dehydrogenase-like flavoprotein
MWSVSHRQLGEPTVWSDCHGAALYPQNPGANPTGTIGALTLRTADALKRRYFKAPTELL